MNNFDGKIIFKHVKPFHFHDLQHLLVDGSSNFFNSHFIAAIRGTAGSLGNNSLFAFINFFSTVGVVVLKTPALTGLPKVEQLGVSQAPFGPRITDDLGRRASVVFGRHTNDS